MSYDRLINKCVSEAASNLGCSESLVKAIMINNFNWLRGSISNCEYVSYLMPCFGTFEFFEKKYDVINEDEAERLDALRIYRESRVVKDNKRHPWYDELDGKKKQLVNNLMTYDCCDIKELENLGLFKGSGINIKKVYYCPDYSDPSMLKRSPEGPHWCKNYISKYITSEDINMIIKTLKDNGYKQKTDEE
jgi:hypothetical protein